MSKGGGRREHGLSLLEVLVAMAILAFVAFGIAGLLARSMATGASGFDDALIAAAARNTLIELQSLPFDHPKLGVGNDLEVIDSSYDQLVVTYQVSGYRIDSWQDAQSGPWLQAGPEDANLKLLSVTVVPVQDDRRQLTISAIKTRGSGS
jgi:prepilin-type N-terminal cleavage/methylation domain-containing protein